MSRHDRDDEQHDRVAREQGEPERERASDPRRADERERPAAVEETARALGGERTGEPRESEEAEPLVEAG